MHQRPHILSPFAHTSVRICSPINSFVGLSKTPGKTSQIIARFVKLDEWIVMPNHLHGIIIITETICRDLEYESTTSPHKDILISDASFLRSASPGSLGVIIGNFKSVVTRRINRMRKSQGGKVWQRGYYERIVRNDRELNAIRQYISDNPQLWSEYRENLDNVIQRMDQMR